jgi:hypothetical protein
MGLRFHIFTDIVRDADWNRGAAHHLIATGGTRRQRQRLRRLFLKQIRGWGVFGISNFVCLKISINNSYVVLLTILAEKTKLSCTTKFAGIALKPNNTMEHTMKYARHA